MMFTVKQDDSSFQRKINEYKKISEEALIESLKVVGIQALTWMNNGSSKESTIPPVLRGFLHGSASVFLGSVLVAVYTGGKGNNKLANKSYSETDKFKLTFGWNASYAKGLHEDPFKPGPVSQQAGNVGSKWAEKHIKNDKDLLAEMLAKEFKQRTGQ